jgi:hypothetical protein
LGSSRRTGRKYWERRMRIPECNRIPALLRICRRNSSGVNLQPQMGAKPTTTLQPFLTWQNAIFPAASHI